MSKPKEVVCPHCHKSVMAKGMRKHIALTCTMVPAEIRKEMKGRMRGDKERSTILGVILGVFLFFFFGLFFTLTPFFFYQLGLFNTDETFTLLVFIASAIPFLMAGLFIQNIGLGLMRGEMKAYGSHAGNQDPDFFERHDFH